MICTTFTVAESIVLQIYDMFIPAHYQTQEGGHASMMSCCCHFVRGDFHRISAGNHLPFSSFPFGNIQDVALLIAESRPGRHRDKTCAHT